MAKCFNINDPGYQIINNIYKSEIDTNNIINGWQDVNNTDVFPTPFEVETYLNQKKKSFSLKQKLFGESLLSNLRRERIGHNFKDSFYVNNSNPATREYDEMFLQSNVKRLKRYLDINNIPQDTINLTRTKESFRVTINDDMFSPKDMIDKSRAWDTPRSRAVVTHLMRLFPGIKVKMITPGQANVLLKSFPNSIKQDANSFYVDGTAYLIQGRVTDETAIEEMMHPFIESVRLDNKELYDGLLAEASKTFPSMVQEIKDAYNADRGFNETDRNIEIVTQALTRHFKREYETQPTKSFLDKIKEFLEWFSEVIQNLNEYLTGRAIPVTAINPNTTLTGIAKLLNTEGIEFKLNVPTNGRVRFSLSSEKQKQVTAAKSKGNSLQRTLVDRMTMVSTKLDEEVSTLAVNANEDTPTDVVALNEADHTYYNLNTGKEYRSVTNVIKGDLQIDYDATLEIEVGNQVDALLDYVVTNMQSDSIVFTPEQMLENITKDTKLKIDKLEKEIAQSPENSSIAGTKSFQLRVLKASLDQMQAEDVTRISIALETALDTFKPAGSIMLTQVTLFDKSTEIAGTADVIIITEEGKIKILDLKTSKNSIYEKRKGQKVGDPVINPYSDTSYAFKPEQSGSLVFNAGVDSMTLKTQQMFQVNLYRRMLENMGYEFDFSEDGSDVVTLHFSTGIKDVYETKDGEVLRNEKGTRIVKDKTFGTIKYEGVTKHPPGQFKPQINKIIPATLDNFEADKLDRQTQGDPNKPYRGKDEDFSGEEGTINEQVYPEYNSILTALDKFRIGLISVQEAEKAIRSNIFRDRTKLEQRDRIAMHISYIGYALQEGGIKASSAYTSFLKDSIDEIKAFKEYVLDPNNMDDGNYITYVLNYNRFAETFRGLYQMKEDEKELNAVQKSLLFRLTSLLNELKEGVGNQPPIIRTAVDNFVKADIKARSNRDYGGINSLWTEENLEEVIKYAKDINGIELQTRDMDTSPDVMLALMAKMFKSKNQELLDQVQLQKDRIARFANPVLQLSGLEGKEAFKFAFAKDDEGGIRNDIVQRIGAQYNILKAQFYAPLSDNTGTKYIYAPVNDLDVASEEDIKNNIRLAQAKEDFGLFLRAEQKDPETGQPVAGNYHQYTQEFKNARDKYEVWNPGNEGSSGYWLVRNKYVGTGEFAVYENKYYQTPNAYTKAIKVDGKFNGVVVENVKPSRPFVKPDFIEVRDVAADGTNMMSKQYVEIMNPTDALGVAQKEFYENIVLDLYQDELLSKLDPGIRTMMINKVPLQKDKFIKDMTKKPTFVNKVFSKIISKEAWSAFTGTYSEKTVVTDELGNIVSSLPIYYVGSPKDTEAIVELEKQISDLKEERKNGNIKKDEYKQKMYTLRGKVQQLEATPTIGEINTDLGESILAFTAMAENYSVMSEIEDTLRAYLQVIGQREYGDSDPSLDLGKMINGVFKKIGKKQSETEPEANIVKRAKKFMSMVYYDNENVNKGAWDKIADGLIQISSLAYVAFNPFGNFNNYVIGRINNTIEALGGRFYSRSAYVRAEMIFNKRAIPDLIYRTSHSGAKDFGNLVTVGLIPGANISSYDSTKANSKYEAFVDSFRMMDPMSQLREQTESTSNNKSWFARASEWGYILQDAAEYNVQTKNGMAILIDTQVKNSKTEEQISFYDAFDYNPETHKNELRPGFDTIIRINGKSDTFNPEGNVSFEKWYNKIRYDIRNEIREVNKQIHGNYAKEDRMVMQSITIGKLAAQFHKWIAPAIRARYQTEYFDENLGFMEGRYVSFIKFLSYVFEQVRKGEIKTNYKDGFLEDYGYTGEGGNRDQRAMNKLQGFYRTMGEIGIMMSVLITSIIFSSILSGDEDDSETIKRLKNVIKYQADRTLFELVMFLPIAGGTQQMQMVKSPIASTRTMGELSEALWMTLETPFYMMVQSDLNVKANKDVYYQQGKRKGDLKIWKNWGDALPVLHTFNKWRSYSTMEDFFIQ